MISSPSLKPKHNCSPLDYMCLGYLVMSDFLEAELVGLLRGLELACQRGVQQITYYSDSTLTISLVRFDGSKILQYKSLIRNIQELLAREWEVELISTLREGNMCVDHLAKSRANQALHLQILEEPPEGLGSLLLADAMRLAQLRLQGFASFVWVGLLSLNILSFFFCLCLAFSSTKKIY